MVFIALLPSRYHDRGEEREGESCGCNLSTGSAWLYTKLPTLLEISSAFPQSKAKYCPLRYRRNAFICRISGLKITKLPVRDRSGRPLKLMFSCFCPLAMQNDIFQLSDWVTNFRSPFATSSTARATFSFLFVNSSSSNCRTTFTLR